MITWITIKNLFGFGTKPANLYVLIGTAFLVVVAVSIFFLSYSLARHKKMVARLRAVVIQKEAELDAEKLKTKQNELRDRLKHLDKKGTMKTIERKKITAAITQTNLDLNKAKKVLKADIKRLKGKSLEALLAESDQLTRDTL